MSNVKERLTYIDTAKFIGIFVLLFEHTGNFINITNDFYNNVKLLICSFHMPLFFLLLGMVASRKTFNCMNDVKYFLNGKFKSLIVPYLLWGGIYSRNLDLKFFAGLFYGSNPSLSYAQTNAVLWFLPAMFSSIVLYQICVWIENKFKLKYIVPIEMIILLLCAYICSKLGNSISIRIPWGVDIAILGTLFIMIGYHLLSPCFIKMLNLTRGKKSVILLSCLAIGIFVVFFNKPDESSVYSVPVMALALYGKNILLFVIGAVFTTGFILGISKVLDNKLFSFLGRNSLV